MLSYRHLASLVILVSASGCGLTGGPNVRVLSVDSSPPAEVEVVVSVQDEEGAVSYLDSSSFSVQENSVELDPSQNPVSLGDPREIVRETLVVFDESLLKDPVIRQGLERGLAHIVEVLSRHSRVVLLGFGGDAHLHPKGQFERTASPTSKAISLAPEATIDNARNLNGAVLHAFERTEDGRRTNKRYQGMIVLIAFGADTAGRVPSEALQKKAAPDWNALFGAEPEDAPIHALDGADGTVRFTPDDLAMRLLDLAMLVRDHLSSTYLVRYCSSARAGTRKVSVRVHYEGQDGMTRGGLASSPQAINVSHFRAGCQIAEITNASRTDGSEGPLVDEAANRAPDAQLGLEQDAPETSLPPATEQPKKPKPASKPDAQQPTRRTPPPTVVAPPTVIAPPASEAYR